MNYYIADDKDPIIKVYQQHIPGHHSRRCRRCPRRSRTTSATRKRYFTIQAHMLLRYHMTDPNVFYNNEDAWHIANQVYREQGGAGARATTW